MSDSRRVALIFGAAAALAGGGLYYFFKVYQPKQERAVAATEIEAWEQRLDQVRLCLLGPKPASSRAGEALAVRELAPDVWDRASCTKLIGKLSRGVAEDTGLLKVEHAWMTIDRAAAKVATAFASHVDPSGDAPRKRGNDSPLPAALDDLDAARAELRQAAGMDPPPASGPAALPAAEIVPLADGADPVTGVSAWLIPSAGGTLGFGTVKGKGEVQLTLVAGAPPRLDRLPPGALRAAPDRAWGAAGLREAVAIAPIDERGAFGAMTTFPVELGARVLIAVGTMASGLVAYAASNHLVIARAAGAPFALDKPIEVGRMAFALDPAGRGLVAWSPLASDGPMHGFIARDGTPPVIVELGDGVPAQACLTATRGWVAGAGQFVSFDERGAAPHVLPDHQLVGCTSEGALLHRDDTTHYAICTDGCRGADLSGLRPTEIATIAGGKVYAIRARGRVIGVWTEGKPPRFYATEQAVTPTLAMSNGKVIDVLGETEDRAVIVRVPL